MPAPAAVAVHDDFAAREAGVALRTANDETSGGIDQKLGRAVDHRFGEHLANHFLDAEFLDLAMVDVFSVLGGDDDVRNADGLSVLVNDGDLRLRVGAEPRRLPAFANASELTAEAMSKHDRGRHQLGR